ncbi:MAG TPA: phosphoglycolate phosphatase [Candidatus Omnitrophota bacterium]|nr:phosphoglycolate phosphatase [Candidatus Omnitrophota bacterium]
MPPRFKAVVFDLDGTLIHSVPDLTVAVNKLLAEEGRPALADADVGPMVGDGVGMLVRRAFTAAGGVPEGDLAPYVARFVAHYEPHAADLTRPYPGVIATLRSLKAKGLKLAVCTNKVSGATRRILAALEIERYFDAVVGGDDTPVHKPDPTHVRITLDKLGVSDAETLYVGDSENDVKAAKGAGLPVVLVTFGYTRIPVAELGGDLLIDRFQDLPAAMGRL